MKISVIYEDRWLVILDKPSGILTIPAPGGKSKALTDILNEDLKKRDIPYRLHPCHRLDRGTSGLIIYAKGKSAQRKMMQEFKLKKVNKTYIAFVQGRISQRKGLIRNPINGGFALTQYQVLKHYSDFTVVQVRPLTGRKNQIRIHFKEINHPIVGEDRFAFRRDFEIKCNRLCLHAKSLEFRHPITKETVSINSNLPQNLEEFLRRYNN